MKINIKDIIHKVEYELPIKNVFTANSQHLAKLELDIENIVKILEVNSSESLVGSIYHIQRFIINLTSQTINGQSIFIEKGLYNDELDKIFNNLLDKIINISTDIYQEIIKDLIN